MPTSAAAVRLAGCILPAHTACKMVPICLMMLSCCMRLNLALLTADATASVSRATPCSQASNLRLVATSDTVALTTVEVYTVSHTVTLITVNRTMMMSWGTTSAVWHESIQGFEHFVPSKDPSCFGKACHDKEPLLRAASHDCCSCGCDKAQ